MAEDSVRDRLVKQLRALKEEADDLNVAIQLAAGDERADLQYQLSLVDEQIKRIETDLRVLQPKEIQIAYEKEWKELDEKLRKAKKDLIRIDSIDTTGFTPGQLAAHDDEKRQFPRPRS